MADAAVSLNKITVAYGKAVLLKDVSLEVPEGITQVIIGANGAGKSTLLKVINGLVRPRSGKVKTIFRRQEIGYIPQNMGLVKTTTVWENVMQGALGRIGNFRALLKWFPEEEKAQAAHLLSVLDLSKKSKQLVSTLSGGECRRVAIARALMQHPRVLLADEIFSDLDFVKARAIIEKLKKLKEEFNLTIIMVEHDFCLAKELGDKIALLSDGELKTDLSGDEICSKNLCNFF